MEKVLITGGSGLVGTKLTELLQNRGFEVFHLSRKSGGPVKTFRWNPGSNYIDHKAISQADYIINLAGAGVVAKRWSEGYKNEIYKSRVSSTLLIHDTLSTVQHHIKKLVNASAIGIYGDNPYGLVRENTAPGDTFLAKTCKDWEAEAMHIHESGIPVSIVRIGIVLSDKGGFLAKMKTTINRFAGAVLGKGDQVMSWIHINDLCEIIIKVMLDEKTDVYNAVAPGPVSNKTMTQLIAKRLHRRLLLPPVPRFVLKKLFGEMSTEMLVSQAVSSRKIQESGYVFQFPTIDKALSDLLH